ncbi:hypothetical protein G647_06640 [Cladophialophora carrionii CBS 160.54]|uniref:BZIP domain-containing protein n=1 Tax=Cladophialophora carrionii CBS 160.54 TaxID=1279043 RepID=V9D6M5_9EURO|nr:uncharacterized protein G647_06640 [Cladophialophora carrionii CBS 160.54]ETI22564.1 hypothetical protein G647_06640 [Cladophialophora carrionii CBS 160.54]
MAGPSDIVDPSTLSVAGYSQTYPTTPPMSDDGRETSQPASEQPTKKKRKAWGQPVPEIKQILPPRKRAKTAEEKEQRKNERILRNRRAADKSRQRQKAAVAELEIRQIRIEKENAALRELLDRYQSRFGVQADFPVPLPTEPPLVDLDSAPSPSDLRSNTTPAPFTPSSFNDSTEVEAVRPILVQSEQSTPVKHESPVLAPQLNLIHEHPEAEQTNSQSMTSLPGFPNVSVSAGDLGYQPASVSFDDQEQSWDQLPASGLPDFDDISLLLDDNALTDVSAVPDFGAAIVNDLDGAGFLLHPDQLPTNSFFDFDAFDTDQTGGLSYEASESTTSLQPTHGASLTDCDRPGFAASG